ncbi:hypothetical protein EDC04DRAFT_2604413 [Pisolithus marmoratus]|nr:hypothetical protein EDC04DRAFT_2604413 [Pisolithus marmoratus]
MLEKQHAFTIALTVYSSLKKNMKGKTSASKEHTQENMGRTNTRSQSISAIPSSLCLQNQCISDAMDVNNENNYKEMVKKLHCNHSSTTKILIDMKQVKRLPLSESGDETSDASDEDDHLIHGINDPLHKTYHSIHLQKSSSQGAGDLDTHLAQWQIKLQQLHKNEQDEGYTYIGPMGTLPLTPAMILDWCHTLSGLLPSSTPATPGGHPVPSPVTPTRGDKENASSSPLFPSPTQLSHFLHFAKLNLGVSNATRYEVNLKLQGIGLDILTEVNDKVLADTGISIGNIIHLKRGCMVWWNSSDVK